MKKGRVSASFCRYIFLKPVKNTGFYPKIDQADVQEMAKTHGFYNVLSSSCPKCWLKLGVFDDFVTIESTKT